MAKKKTPVVKLKTDFEPIERKNTKTSAQMLPEKQIEYTIKSEVVW